MKKVKLKTLNTYVYIDSSNIRNALKVSRVKLDFEKLYQYLSKTYPNLKFVKYFEGIDKTDAEKLEVFDNLGKIGYDMKTLERKAYTNSPKFKTIRCTNCEEKNKVEILKKSETLKSNVDVYLCSELMGDLLPLTEPSHAIILTCDGDYAEMIKNILEKNTNVNISVLSTPFTKYNNYLSIRLKQLKSLDRYNLVNILNIKDRVGGRISKSQKSDDKDKRENPKK